eukprot:14065582-Alexandrium_andersonii.AAC.1
MRLPYSSCNPDHAWSHSAEGAKGMIMGRDVTPQPDYEVRRVLRNQILEEAHATRDQRLLFRLPLIP